MSEKNLADSIVPLIKGIEVCLENGSDKYIDPENTFNCTSLDLYGARCGLLHRLNADSRISERGKAKLIGYYTKSEDNKMGEAIQKHNKADKYASIQVEKFAQVYREGILHFCADLRDDPVTHSLVKEKAKRSFPVFEVTGPYEIIFEE